MQIRTNSPPAQSRCLACVDSFGWSGCGALLIPAFRLPCQAGQRQKAGFLDGLLRRLGGGLGCGFGRLRRLFGYALDRDFGDFLRRTADDPSDFAARGRFSLPDRPRGTDQRFDSDRRQRHIIEQGCSCSVMKTAIRRCCGLGWPWPGCRRERTSAGRFFIDDGVTGFAGAVALMSPP